MRYESVSINDWASFDVEVVSLPRDSILIGSDLLNQVVLRADGPSEVFELIRP